MNINNNNDIQKENVDNTRNPSSFLTKNKYYLLIFFIIFVIIYIFKYPIIIIISIILTYYICSNSPKIDFISDKIKSIV